MKNDKKLPQDPEDIFDKTIIETKKNIEIQKQKSEFIKKETQENTERYLKEKLPQIKKNIKNLKEKTKDSKHLYWYVFDKSKDKPDFHTWDWLEYHDIYVRVILSPDITYRKKYDELAKKILFKEDIGNDYDNFFIENGYENDVDYPENDKKMCIETNLPPNRIFQPMECGLINFYSEYENFHVELIDAKMKLPKIFVGEEDTRIENRNEFPSCRGDSIRSSTTQLRDLNWHNLSSNNSINLFAKLIATYVSHDEPNIYSLKNIFPKIYESREARLKHEEGVNRLSEKMAKSQGKKYRPIIISENF